MIVWILLEKRAQRGYFRNMTRIEGPNPDELLAALKKEESQQRRGALKVFLGMCAGAGKTYAMLESAQKAKKAGIDVVIGYVETHGRKETDALKEGIEVVQRRATVYRGVTLTEMDLDALLKRHSQLVLVDELAHTNAPDSRHPKRYQDVLELLDAGIDVFTTLNVQHVESRTDTVREITGAQIQETVPDTVLGEAEIELVDLSPEELLQRLSEGKVYLPEQAATASTNFFREGNLVALREMALRLAAEKAGQNVREYMRSKQISGPWKLGPRLLVAVSASPHSEQMIRWTRRMVDSLGCTWIAAHVETSHVLSEEEQSRLTRHMELARSLGAETRSTADDDVVAGLLRVAREQNVTEIVVGKPTGIWPFGILRSAHFLNRLIRESGNIGLHVMRTEESSNLRAHLSHFLSREAGWRQYLQALLGVSLVTLINMVLDVFVGPRSTGLVYLMTVVLMALFLYRGPVYLTAATSALLWNYFFLPPRMTFHIDNIDDMMMFSMYFIVALAMGHLISRLRAKDRMDRRREERATAMYMLTLELGDASSWEDIVRAAVSNVERTFTAKGALLLPDVSGKLRSDLPEREYGAAVWAFEHMQATGRFSDTLPMADGMYFPLRTTGNALGVLRLQWQQKSPPTIDQRSMLDGFVRHIALVIDRQRLREMKAQTKVLAESERLSQALLNAVSHELRTPIAAIVTATSGLDIGTNPAVHKAMVNEIRQAGERLNRLVANLLDMARLESGHVTPHMDWCDVSDLINAALKRVTTELANRTVSVNIEVATPLVRVDFRLIEQALVDLLLNAAMHTPHGSPVEVSAHVKEHSVVITVGDHGTGLAAEALPRIFDKFYRAPGAVAGGTGLGLSIVKGFVEANGGSIQAANRPSGGAMFSVALPLQEQPIV